MVAVEKKVRPCAGHYKGIGGQCCCDLAGQVGPNMGPSSTNVAVEKKLEPCAGHYKGIGGRCCCDLAGEVGPNMGRSSTCPGE
jgi:hypothetical protein